MTSETTNETTPVQGGRKGGFTQGAPLSTDTTASAGLVCCGEVAVSNAPVDQASAGCCGEVTTSGSGGCCGEPAAVSPTASATTGGGSGCCN